MESHHFKRCQKLKSGRSHPGPAVPVHLQESVFGHFLKLFTWKRFETILNLGNLKSGKDARSAPGDGEREVFKHKTKTMQWKAFPGGQTPIVLTTLHVFLLVFSSYCRHFQICRKITAERSRGVRVLTLCCFCKKSQTAKRSKERPVASLQK